MLLSNKLTILVDMRDGNATEELVPGLHIFVTINIFYFSLDCLQERSVASVEMLS